MVGRYRPLHWLLIVVLGITGVFAGRRVGIELDAVEGRSVGDLLRTLSGTFSGLFGFLVSIAFVFNRLEDARTHSSRLTTSLTIIILALSDQVGSAIGLSSIGAIIRIRLVNIYQSRHILNLVRNDPYLLGWFC